MKRFLLFVGRDYYPDGGAHADEYVDWAHVYDLERDRIVRVWAEDRYPGGWRTLEMRRGGHWDEWGYESPDTGTMIYWSEQGD